MNAENLVLIGIVLLLLFLACYSFVTKIICVVIVVSILLYGLFLYINLRRLSKAKNKGK